jgi:hypothetical protein
MASAIPVYLEAGRTRVFAGALAWPGWCRSGKTQQDALDALVAYARRYRRALGRAATGFAIPGGPDDLDVTETLTGNRTTDFGAPAMAPSGDDEPIESDEATRLRRVLQAAWAAFDRRAEEAADTSLRLGPRGGGRQVDAMVSHVIEADRAYLAKLGGSFGTAKGEAEPERRDRIRAAFLDVWSARAGGEPPPRTPRSGSLWSLRYAVRRSAWHALDHTWEIEDRSA